MNSILDTFWDKKGPDYVRMYVFTSLVGTDLASMRVWLIVDNLSKCGRWGIISNNSKKKIKC